MFLNLLSFSLLPLSQASSGNNAVFPELSNVFNWAIGLGAILALMSIIYSGIIYTVSSGNESLKKQAVERIKAAILGMAFLMGAYILLRTIDPGILGSQSKIPQFPKLQVQQPPEPPEPPADQTPAAQKPPILLQDDFGLSEKQKKELEEVFRNYVYGRGFLGVIVEKETGNIYPIDMMGLKVPRPLQCEQHAPRSNLLPPGNCSR